MGINVCKIAECHFVHLANIMSGMLSYTPSPWDLCLDRQLHLHRSLVEIGTDASSSSVSFKKNLVRSCNMLKY